MEVSFGAIRWTEPACPFVVRGYVGTERAWAQSSASLSLKWKTRQELMLFVVCLLCLGCLHARFAWGDDNWPFLLVTLLVALDHVKQRPPRTSARHRPCHGGILLPAVSLRFPCECVWWPSSASQNGLTLNGRTSRHFEFDGRCWRNQSLDLLAYLAAGLA